MKLLSITRHDTIGFRARLVILVIMFVVILPVLGSHNTFAENTPEVRVENLRRIPHNGEHNAFTDLCRFGDRYYLAFRSCPDGHMVHPSSSIIVLSSRDTESWEQVCRFNVPKRDTRDPHFLVFNNRLFVYTGTWYCGDSSPKTRDLNEHLGYCVRTDNGRDWSEPIMLEGTFGHYVWRAAAYDGKAYLCGRRKHEFTKEYPYTDRSVIESAMLVSDDGAVWKKAALFQERDGDETAFRFEPDGGILAIARRGSGNAQICRSKPPYTDWNRLDFDRYIGGPLVAQWNGRTIVAGRKKVSDTEYVNSFYWLVGENELVEFATLPSGGDNSYPGFCELGPNRALISYYSSHEKDDNGKTITAVYLAELVME